MEKKGSINQDDQEERFRYISSSISDISYSCRTEPNGSYAVDWLYGAVEKMTAYSTDELFELKCWGKLVIAEDLPVFNTHITGTAPGLSDTCELRLKRKDGQVIWIQASAQCVKDKKHPEITVLYGALVDISERKNAEAALRQSEKKFRNLFEHSPIGTSMTRVDGTIHVNKAFCDLLGYSETELMGKKWQEISHPDDIQKTSELLTKLLEGKSNEVRFEKRYIHKNGKVIWADVSTFLERDLDGLPEYYITAVNDITERRLAEEALRAVSSRNEAILESVPDIIMEVDVNKIYTWTNHAGNTFFGDDVLGKEAAFYFVGEQETYNIVKPLFNGSADHIIYVESWQRRRDGENRLLAWWCRTLKNNNGVITGTLSAAQDITDRKHAEAELIKIKKELEVLVEEKTKELKERVAELERFHNATIDREFRIKELRDEIARLKENRKN